jgi:hypothetical protein
MLLAMSAEKSPEKIRAIECRSLNTLTNCHCEERSDAAISSE